MKTAWAFAVGILSLFVPIKPLLIATAVLIGVDLITGVGAAIKRKEAITSARLRDTLSKLFIYEVALCAAFVAETYISDAVPLVKMASTMVALTELRSVYENLNEISGTNLLKSAIDKLGSQNTST